MAGHGSPRTVIILNPQSGSGDQAKTVENRAELLGYALKRTETAGDGTTLAREAIEGGAATIVAAGGDGTVNEVIHGIDRAAGFDKVTLGILPCGTGNNFAKNIGITDVDSGFAALERGERRRIDLGQTDSRLFVNSCVAGLTAESSGETSQEMKSRLGVLAYVITTFRSVSDFETLRLTVEINRGKTRTETWAGEAICVLVGNGRRFSVRGTSQANMEDGLLDVAVIKDVPVLDLMSDTLLEHLLGQDSANIVRSLASALTITIQHPESTRFSFDGEIVQQEKLAISVRPRVLEVAVGDAYDPTPDSG